MTDAEARLEETTALLSSNRSNTNNTNNTTCAVNTNNKHDAHARKFPTRLELFNILNSFRTFDGNTRVIMHSVGALSQDEQVDGYGTIYQLSSHPSQSHYQNQPRYNSHLSQVRMTGSHQTTPHYRIHHQSTGDTHLRRPHVLDLFPPFEEKLNKEEIVETQYQNNDTIQAVPSGGSLTAAVFGIIKGAVGPAILFLPRGFSLAGYGIAIPSLMLSVASYVYTSTRLLECWKSQKDKAIRSKSHANVSSSLTSHTSIRHNTHSLLLTYPELARRAFGPYAFLVSIGIAMLQYGVCLTYFIFVPQNLYTFFRTILIHYCNPDTTTDEMMTNHIPTLWKHIFSNATQTHYLIFMVLFQIPLAWMNDIRQLAPYNIFATILIASSLLSCVYLSIINLVPDVGKDMLNVTDPYEYPYDADHDDHLISLWKHVSSLPFIEPKTWGLFIGTSFYVFEGSITLLLPLQEAISNPSDRTSFPNVNRHVMWMIMLCYICFSMICWAGLSSTNGSSSDNTDHSTPTSVHTALTTSLPSGHVLTQMVQLWYSIAVMFTFPLQCFPAMAVVWDMVHPKRHLHKDDFHTYSSLLRNSMSSLIIISLGILAHMCSNDLGNVVSLLGSMMGIPIAWIYPPLIHNILCHEEISVGRRRCNVCMSGLGCIAMISATYLTVDSWKDGSETE